MTPLVVGMDSFSDMKITLMYFNMFCPHLSIYNYMKSFVLTKMGPNCFTFLFFFSFLVPKLDICCKFSLNISGFGGHDQGSRLGFWSCRPGDERHGPRCCCLSSWPLLDSNSGNCEYIITGVRTSPCHPVGAWLFLSHGFGSWSAICVFWSPRISQVHYFQFCIIKWYML